MNQGYVQSSPMATCANGHPCNQYVTSCRICGAAVTTQIYQPPQEVHPIQAYIESSPAATCANGHPCNQYVTACRICGAPVTTRSYQSPQRSELLPAYQRSFGVDYRTAAAVYRGPLPSVWPTVLVTFFFGIFGVIPASIHTSRAREAGRRTNTYWAAFGWTMAASILLWILLLVLFYVAIATSVSTRY